MEKNKLSKLLLLLGILFSGIGFLVWLACFITIQFTRVSCSLAVPSCAFAAGLLLIIFAVVVPYLPKKDVLETDKKDDSNTNEK